MAKRDLDESGAIGLHSGELGSVTTGNLLDTEGDELLLQFIELLEEFVLLLDDQFDGPHFVVGVRHCWMRDAGRRRLAESTEESGS